MSEFVEIKGVVPVLSTPLDSDRKLDAKTLRREIEWVGEHGVKSVASGMVSEILRMNLRERKELTESICASAADFNMNSIVSCGQETPELTIDLVLHAQDSGADAVMINPPIASKLSDDDIFNYFSAVFEKTVIPIVVQDASGYVGYSINVSVLTRLFKQYSERIYFKPEAVPIGQRLSDLRDATGGKARIFEGTGGAHLVDSFTRGVVGTMPGAEVPWALVALFKALKDYKIEDKWGFSGFSRDHIKTYVEAGVVLSSVFKEQSIPFLEDLANEKNDRLLIVNGNISRVFKSAFLTGKN
jgi:4-hydroxy-tetrahydrodipicolinate synthase